MPSHLWSGAMWLHTLPQLTWQSWQKETLQTWYHWTINIKQLWLKKFSTPCNGTHPKVIIPIQLPSPGSCSLPSGSSNDMWPWWYKPSSGKVRSKSSNNEASRRNLWSSVCCREGCGNNAQRSIHSVLRGTSCNVFFFLPVQLDTPENEKSSCLTEKDTFPMFWKVDDDFDMLEDMCWMAWVLSSMLIQWRAWNLFWNRNVICDGSGCTTFAIRFYWHIAFLTLPPSHPPFESKMFELCFGPRIFSGSGTTPRFNLPCHTTSHWGSWRTKMRRAQGALVLIDSKGENQGVVVICINQVGRHLGRPEIGNWMEWVLW